MKYIFERQDGEKDLITKNKFDTYEEAYDFLQNLYGDICCSDTDFEDIIYYDIKKLN